MSRPCVGLARLAALSPMAPMPKTSFPILNAGFPRGCRQAGCRHERQAGNGGDGGIRSGAGGVENRQADRLWRIGRANLAKWGRPVRLPRPGEAFEVRRYLA